MPDIQVNGTTIPEAVLAAEVQHHPADSFEAAREAAARALAVRELLVQEAARRGLGPGDAAPGGPPGEAAEEATIRALLEACIPVRDPDESACRAEYDAHPDRYRSPDLFEAAHILFPAAPEDEAARQIAKGAADRALAAILAEPRRFADLARDLSACPSGAEGGRLGQVARGDTCPELESFFYVLAPGQIAPTPVPSRYGYHVLRLDRRALGAPLPYEAVRQRIADRLRERAWRRDVAAFVAILAERAEIVGVRLDRPAPALAAR